MVLASIGGLGNPLPRPALWRCRSPGCPVPLGLVKGQTFITLIPGTRLDGDGSARVLCPLCKQEQVWYTQSWSK